MAAPVDWLGVGARLAELWLVRGQACPACPRAPPCPAQTCTLTCSGPATSLTEGLGSQAPGGGPTWLALLLLAAAGGAGLAWTAGRAWPAQAKEAAPEAAAPPAITGPVGTGPVTPSQRAQRA